MQRRDFIKLSTRTAIALAMSGVANPLMAGSTTVQKTIINLMLDGGPDFRHLIVPAYEASNNDPDSYAAKFWKARASIFNVTSESDLKKAYNDNYNNITISGIKCGILKIASWLEDQITAGNVAIVSNAIASTNRNHYHSKLVMESGDMDASPYNLDVSGWLGRSARGLGKNLVSVTSEVRLSCNGPVANHPEKHDNSMVINNQDSRNLGLFNYDTQGDLDNNSNLYRYYDSAYASRALKSYYEAKRGMIPSSSPYHKAMEHEKNLRDFGDRVKSILDANALPEKIANLNTKNHQNKLNSSYFAKQIASVYDSFVTKDIFDMSVISMDYNGWDSHKRLRTQIEPRYEDMFGTDKGFDALISSLDDLDTDIYKNMTIVISGEFGRQLKSNGDNGNDHGRGNTVLVIGEAVKGKLYGDIFPDSELSELNVKNKDIEGKTSIFRIYSEILDWQQSGLGATVFGDISGHPLESGVDLSKIYT